LLRVLYLESITSPYLRAKIYHQVSRRDIVLVMIRFFLLCMVIQAWVSLSITSGNIASPSVTPIKVKRVASSSYGGSKSKPSASLGTSPNLHFGQPSSVQEEEGYMSEEAAEQLFRENIRQILSEPGPDGKLSNIQLAAGTPTAAPTLPPSAKITPPNCLSEDDSLEEVNGIFSATNTFLKCYQNIADPLTIPTFYNGTFNGVMYVYTNIQLNNLHQVRCNKKWIICVLFILFLTLIFLSIL
jgi:hypothetical protein